MIQLKGNGLKILKIIHLIGACCWIGGAISMLVLNVSSKEAASPAMLYGINFSAHMIDLWVVVALGVYICLISGFLYGLLTPFGFFKYKWVIVKWVVTIFCFLSGWLFLGSWETEMLNYAQEMTDLANPDYAAIRNKHFGLSLLQISLLIFMVIISVFKPWKNKINLL